MKTSILIFVVLLFVAACKLPERYFTVVNDLDMKRVDALIEIPGSEFEKYMGTVLPGKFLLLRDEKGDTIPYQLLDLDGQPGWEEMVIVTNLEAQESKQIYVEYIDSMPQFDTRTNIRFSPKGRPEVELDSAIRLETTETAETQQYFQFEGTGWENDKVGFRNYFDQRNAFDIFGKTTSAMVLDEVGLTGDYHALQEWGMDILKVGNSLGLGSLALWSNDSLYRLGDNGAGSFRLISEGSLRSVFEFNHNNWKAHDQSYDVQCLVEITAGQYFFTLETSFDSLKGALPVTGLVNMKASDYFSGKLGEHQLLFSYDEQAEDTSGLGMALMVEPELFAGFSETPDSGRGITQSWCLKLEHRDGQSFKCHIFACWARSTDQFKDKDGFTAYLKEWSARLRNPVKVKW